MVKKNVGLRPVAYQRLKEVTEEISRKRGVKITMAAVVEAAIELIDRLESMEHENDMAGFDAGNPDRRIFYHSRTTTKN